MCLHVLAVRVLVIASSSKILEKTIVSVEAIHGGSEYAVWLEITQSFALRRSPDVIDRFCKCRDQLSQVHCDGRGDPVHEGPARCEWDDGFL